MWYKFWQLYFGVYDIAYFFKQHFGKLSCFIINFDSLKFNNQVWEFSADLRNSGIFWSPVSFLRSM